MTYRFEVYHQTNSSVWLGIDIRKISLVNSIHISEKKTYILQEE